MVADLSPCGHDPAELRIYRGRRTDGRYYSVRQCRPCERAKQRDRRAAHRAVVDWSLPLADAERAARMAAWSAGADDAIAAVRAAEGFDGRKRAWQTLGEYLPDPPAPDPTTFVMPPVVVCPGCGVRRFKYVPCRSCRALGRRVG